MKINISNEIQFQTARSGGKGGQNVNKVETQVEGRWLVRDTKLFTTEQISRIQEKLANRITADGFLLVKSQETRSQTENKAIVIEKMNELISKALYRKKIRLSTKPTKASIEKRMDQKKKKAENKSFRKKIDPRYL